MKNGYGGLKETAEKREKNYSAGSLRKDGVKSLRLVLNTQNCFLTFSKS